MRTCRDKIKLIGLLLIIAVLSLGTGCSSKPTIISTATTTVTETTTVTRAATLDNTPPVIEITLPSVEYLFEMQEYLPTINTEENNILSLILDNANIYPKYAVIEPYTFFDESISERKESILNEFEDQGYEVSNLLEQLIEKNQKLIMLDIKSSREHGYYIDYPCYFDIFFIPGLDGWEKMSEYYPEAQSKNRISIPAYDPVTGYVLVCLQVVDSNGGLVRLILYQYEHGKINEIASYQLWELFVP